MISITQDDILKSVGDFITYLLPGFPVVIGQVNRVPELLTPDFAVMWPLERSRIATNSTDEADVKGKGVIQGTTFSVTDIYLGAFEVGQQIFGNGVTTGTVIMIDLGIINGLQSYTVNHLQSVPWTIISGGQREDIQPTQITIQLDVHGPNSADNVQTISTLFWSDADYSASNIEALYCSDPHQLPFINGEMQVEERWTIDLVLQANPVVTTSQEYMDEAVVVSLPINPSGFSEFDVGGLLEDLELLDTLRMLDTL
jgi:hypothetical protein